MLILLLSYLNDMTFMFYTAGDGKRKKNSTKDMLPIQLNLSDWFNKISIHLGHQIHDWIYQRA